LFALYLLFEFQTLWGRVFPPGFHYSGYAHEGAAWLTVALALATALLSIVFRGRMLSDPRLSRLKRLAWLWSLENLLLAIAVYHRLWIYTGFNGMTRMRVVGLLGMTSVVAGFVLVVWKINRQRSFRWLIRRQLWTVAFALYLYCVLPVDGWVQYYNVSSILSGQPAPSVQIVAHETSDEGWLQLEPLLTCEDVVIREGVSALLADRRIELELAASLEASPEHWTARQFARERLRAMLNHHRRDWPDDAGAAAARRAALERFREYAMQWY